MHQTLIRTAEELKKAMDTWENVTAVTRMPLPPGIQDLLPILKMDVYYRGFLPGSARRQLSFTPCQFFEPSEVRKKDRFFRGDLPIHVEYKSVDRVEESVTALVTKEPGLADTSTYGYYRMVHGIAVGEVSPWLEKIKDLLSRLPGDFWKHHRSILESRLEHLVADMGQAELLGDQYLYIQASSRYLESLVELLFTVNGAFVPSPEQTQEVMNLEVLPAGFAGMWDLLTREGALDRSRRIELARKALNLCLKL